MNRLVKIACGAAIWIAILACGWPTWRQSGAEHQTWTRDLSRFWLGSRQVIDIELPHPNFLQVGEPLYEATLSPSYPIGRVISINGRARDFRQPVLAHTAQIEIYSHAYPLKPNDKVTLQATPSSLGWVIQTMFPPDMQQKLTRLIMQAYTEHQADISRELTPIITEVLQKSATVIEEDLRVAVQQRADRFQAVADRYRDSFVDKELLPLMQNEVWPLVRERMTPLSEKVGLRIWEQASLFRLTWRYLYDVSPLPQRDLTRKEFERFLSDQAMPILQEFYPEFNSVQQQLVRDLAANAKVQAVISDGAEQLAKDAEVQQLVWEIVQQTLVQNPRLQAVWRDVWTSPAASAALASSSRRLEPTIAAIGETLFGNPNTAITPEFSRVLRNRVLLKDSRWFLVNRAAVASGTGISANPGATKPAPFVVHLGDPDSPNPFHLPARPRN